MDRRALVTGGSSGIGYELSRLLAGDGYDLVLVASNQEKLVESGDAIRKEFGTDVKVLRKDLSEIGAAFEIYEELRERDLIPDILINNAGFGAFGPFAGQPTEKIHGMIMVNVLALTELTRLFVPEMVKRGSGRILNVSSVAAFMPGPSMAVYFATKAYVQSFTEALSHETEDTGITVSALCPGATRTGFQDRADLKGAKSFKYGVMSAKNVALEGYQGMMEGKTVIITGFTNRLTIRLMKIIPRKIAAHLVEISQKNSG